MTLQAKAREERLLIVDGFDLPEAKTVSLTPFNDIEEVDKLLCEEEG